MPAPAGPTLLVLAAGLGTRFGGLKQCAPVGPDGQTLLDYAVFDAHRAGFGRAVFVLRESFAAEFMARARQRYGRALAVDAVLQDPDDLPDGLGRPPQRERPWGTAHAVLAARAAIDGPFGVVNADDFYGADAYRRVAAFFAAPTPPGRPRWCMVGYTLAQTLSEHGGVNRGICVAAGDRLQAVQELREIRRDADGACHGIDPDGARRPLDPGAIASMNFWGFTPAVFAPMQRGFADFLRRPGLRADAECYIPEVIDTLVRTGEADCHVLHTDSRWFGVTYPQDIEATAACLRELTDQGRYPRTLWP